MTPAQITIVGNVASDPETRTLADGRLRTTAAAAGLHRGTRVVVVGHLRQYDYARDGQRETGYEVQAQEIAAGLSRSASRAITAEPVTPRAADCRLGGRMNALRSVRPFRAGADAPSNGR
jgi:single-stranded DNA-binding protein